MLAPKGRSVGRLGLWFPLALVATFSIASWLMAPATPGKLIKVFYAGGKDCRAFASRNPRDCNEQISKAGSHAQAFCVAYTTRDSTHCNNDECRAIVDKDESLCETSFCKAWVTGESSLCDVDDLFYGDCTSFALDTAYGDGDLTDCYSNTCKALISGDKKYC